jgi:ankyrin repeat protein
MIAVENGDISLLGALIDMEIDLNQANNEGTTPLMLAASKVKTTFMLLC